MGNKNKWNTKTIVQFLGMLFMFVIMITVFIGLFL